MTKPVEASGADVLPTAGVAEIDVEALQREQVEMRNIQAGLDRAVTKITAQRDEAEKRVQALEQRLSAYSTADGANNDVITDYLAQLDALAAERDQFQVQAEEAIRSESRVRLVASEFPELTPLIDANALPRATDDDAFRASLIALQGTLGSAAEARHTEHISGIKPPAAPPATAAPDIDAIKRKMMAAERGSQEFNDARDQWYAAMGVIS